MRQALLSDRVREISGTSREAHYPAPLKGWNTRDPLASMDPLYALDMINVYPGVGDVRLRQGTTDFANRTAAGSIKTLVPFRANLSTSSKLFATTDNGIYDVTAGGAYGAAASASTNGFWSFTNFTNSAGTNFLWGVNGADKVKTFDGTTWADLDGASTPAITGVTVTTLNFCWIFKRRIFAIQKDTMNAWFLPVDSIAGVASKLPIGGLFARGGSLLSGTNWTLDGGNGPDDYCVFITTEGEIAIYQGTDPTSAATFALVGVFFVGRPISSRCFVRVGGDVWIAAGLGLIQLSRLVSGVPFSNRMSVSDAIRPTWTELVDVFKTGWSAVVYPAQNALFINGPSASLQLVLNVITGAWCKFTWANCFCFSVYEDVLYFGSVNGLIYKAWMGATDPGPAPIVAIVTQAYQYVNKGVGTTQIKVIRPLMNFNGNVEVKLGLSVDFEPGSFTSTIPVATGRQQSWRVVSSKQPGFAVALSMEWTTSAATIASWTGTDYIILTGSLM